MGADIHFYVEKKVDDTWQPVKGPNRWYGKWEGERKLALEGWAYSGRNYELFSLLADVRNYGNRIEPLAEPRGLPEDVSEMIEKISDDWEWDGHSYSYFYLSELEKEKDRFKEISPNIIKETIPKLKILSQGDLDSVRVVFWFDN